VLPWLTGVLLLAALSSAILSLVLLSQERSRNDREIARIDSALAAASDRVAGLERQNGALLKRVRSTEAGIVKTQAGVRPLAARALRSVFTVETATGLGTGWAAWTRGATTYLITAHHVVAESVAAGDETVIVRRQGKKWSGTVSDIDEVNDLAVVTVEGVIAKPLWQEPDETISPLAGDELLLVGSPFGLEGTVTTGIVSRVSYSEIQTDAAANPGNSGGPALDREGNVVGVLVSGGGQNINFAIPIQRACVTVRNC
jgi:S1-C subfamily serine protease